MTVIINGTSGITDVNGTAAAPAITGTDTDTGVFFGTNTVSLSTGGTERLQVDSSGNLGLGVTPSGWSGYKALQVSTAAGVSSNGGNGSSFSHNYYYDGTNDKYITTGNAASRVFHFNGAIRFDLAPSGTAGNNVTFTQAMTLDASGNLGVGQTSPTAKLDVVSTNATTAVFRDTSRYALVSIQAGGTNQSAYLDMAPTGTGAAIFQFSGTERMRLDSSGRLLVGYTSIPSAPPSGTVGAVGYSTKKGTGNGLNASGNVFNISWADGLTGAHLWVDTSDLGQITVSSDYRIKKNIESQTAPAIDRLMQLRSVKYELADYGTLFKADGVQREGFIAHELQEIIPSAVDGEKDAENQIQSLRLDALCSVLVKAIQEQQAIIEQLQADVAALKGQA